MTSLESLVAQFDSKELPPVHLWKPECAGQIDIKIDKGEWFYRDSKIERKRMVALFSTILWREGDSYFLITPQEKLAISVEVAPFKALLMDVDGSGESQSLTFTDNAGNQFTANDDHPLWISDQQSQHPLPLVVVRDNLTALLSRPVYYQLADLMVEKDSVMGVWSGGVFFKLDGEANPTAR